MKDERATQKTKQKQETKQIKNRKEQGRIEAIVKE